MRVQDYVRCTECNFESKKEVPFNRLDISIKQFGDPEPISSVQEGMEKYFASETLDGDNKWLCPKCDKKVGAKKGLKLSKVPYILSIGMKRFDYDWMADERVKVNDAVSFELLLNAADFLDKSDNTDSTEQSDEAIPQSPNGTARRNFGKDGSAVMARGYHDVTFADGEPVMLYDLYAIFIHSGGAAGGHYYAYIQDFGTRKWYEYNDSTISGPLTEAQIRQAFGGAVKKTTRFGTYMSSSSAYSALDLTI
jgi:ubiquitin carboxyl-terminal hydrolase 47